MKKISKKGLAAILCMVTIAFTSIGLTIAYFSDYVTAKGQATINLTAEVEIPETVDPDGTKHIQIENKGKTDVVVRVAIYGPWLTTDYQEADIQPATPSDWQLMGGYYYYTKVLPAGEKTSEIEVKVVKGHFSADVENFDITPVFQSAIVTYENGSVAKPEGWEKFPNITE